MAVTDIDEAKLEAFVGHVATELGAAVNAALVLIGDELGLFRAMADGQPVSPEELAARTGTQERYVREWLASQAASGFVILGEDGYVLPPEHALVLADDHSPFAMTGAFQSANAAVLARERVRERFVSGDGLGWHEHHHGLFHGVERAFAAGYRAFLVAEWLPALDGVVERLQDGGSAVDEPLGQALARRDGGVGRLERAGHQERARLVGEHERVLGRQDVRRRLRVVDDEAARRLGVEPLAHVALLRAGPRGELSRLHRLAVGHGLVEAELVAERHEGSVERGAQLGRRVADEGLELLLVDVGDRHDQGATQRS